MKATELRIGNLLIKNGVVVTIDARSIFDICNERDNYSPIPLTEEWFLRFGYTLITSRPRYKVFQGVKYNIYLYSTGEIIMNMGCALKYVHNFQNRIYSLTGEELEVKGEGV